MTEFKRETKSGKTYRICKRCGSVVTKSDNPEYSFQCAECDEDLYSFETEERKCSFDEHADE